MLCRLAHCASVSICCAGLPTVLPCVQILVYVVGIPVLFAAVLWAHDRVVAQDLAASTLTLQTAPDSPPSQQLAAPTGLAIRFLTQSYTQQHRYFEVAECFRRLALTGLLVFIPSQVQVEVACFLTVLSLILLATVQPFNETTDYRAALLAGVALFCSFYIGVLDQQDKGTTDNAFAALVVVLSSALVLVTLAQSIMAARAMTKSVQVGALQYIYHLL
eukprot:TRINITY_DN323_c0_g4_i4.p1 TRINITY_DN323_c0_g4~~TRINITY_DN323_c0_g4_i4.p1  ORF type:complete len:218 (+),score=28.18 TRINITY_DN323_c0_g4_i4:359-1012(+)